MLLSGLCHLDHAADVGDDLALGGQLIRGFDFADDLLGCVRGAFHVGVPGLVWPDWGSYSWTDF